VDEIEVYNGELGFVKHHAFDNRKWRGPYFRLKKFQVVFQRKEQYWVAYGGGLGRGAPDEKPEENLELAYAISVHKAQGSEFERVYFIVPKCKTALLSTELFYTGLTRASRHCTLLVEQDISPLNSMRRLENSCLARISSSLFEFQPVPEAMLQLGDWYEEGKVHRTLADVMVRSKSEVIISNMLWERDIDFSYELALFAPDGTYYLPDFTIPWAGEDYYWEHKGMMDQEKYRNHWAEKEAWYQRHFPGKLITTEESGDLSHDAQEAINSHFS